MNFKKIIALVLVVALTAAVTFGATVAFLTDETEVKQNTFTVGDVDIELTEEVDTEGAAVVVDRPADPANNVLGGASYSSVMPGDKLIKKPTVTNTGDNPAYVTLTVTVNNLAKIQEVLDSQAALDEVFTDWNLVDGAVYTVDTPVDALLLKVDAATAAAAAAGNWFDYDVANDTIAFTYYLMLKPGESFTPFEELNVPAAFDADDLAMFENLDIQIKAAAIQQENMPSATYAFATLRGEDTATAGTNEELKNAIQDGATTVQLSAGTYDIPAAVAGKDVTIVGVDGTVIDYTKAHNVGGANLVFENVTFEGKNANVMNGYGVIHTEGTVVYRNCTFVNAVTNEYTGEVVYENCTFTGTYYITTYAVKSATFVGCTFDRTDSRAILVYSHGNNPLQVLVKDCDFKAAAHGTTWAGDWTAAVEVDTTNITTPGTTVTIENCTVDANYSGIVRDKSAAGATPAVIVVDGVQQ